MIAHKPGVDICLYILTWALLWAGAGSTTKLLNQRLDARHLPTFLLDQRGQRFANYTGLSLSVCLGALLIWGFIHIEWYLVAVLALGGIVVSIPIERACGSVLMIYAAWIPTVLLTGYFWLR